jgi:hypothetical protein
MFVRVVIIPYAYVIYRYTKTRICFVFIVMVRVCMLKNVREMAILATTSICVGGLGARAGAVAWEVVAERMQMR